MKSTFSSLLPLLFIALIVIISCKKNSSTGDINTTTKNQLFAGLKSAPQTITINAGRDTVVYAAGGTMLHFYTYSFLDANKNIIKSGVVNLQIVEMSTPGTMALNRATTTTTDGAQLQSGGQFSMAAFMGTTEISANKFGVGFKQPKASSQPMNLFYGNNNNTDSLTKWTVSDTTKKGTQAKGTTTDSTRSKTNPDFFYIFDTCSNYIFWNCDYYAGNPTTSLSVTFPDNTFNSNNTDIYAIFPSYNIVTPLDEFLNSTNNFTGKYLMPVGEKYELVIVSNKNGTLYYYSQSGTVTDNMTIHATMVVETLGDIIARMKGL
jgi:hypothetical protein